MEASIKTAVVNLRKSITCSVCLEYFSFPVSISCGHTFCKICIHNAMKVKNSCPICSSCFSKRSLVSESHLDHVIIRVARFLDEKSEGATSKGGVDSSELADTPDAKPKGLITPAGKRLKAVELVDTKISSSNVKGKVKARTGPPAPPQLYAVGELVNVFARSWAGVNKPGGTGRIVSCSEAPGKSATDPVFYEYRIRYVLDGSVEADVNEDFIEPYSELSRAGRRSKPESAVPETQTTIKAAAGVVPPPVESGKKRDRASLATAPAAPEVVPVSSGKKSKPASISPGMYWSEQYAELMTSHESNASVTSASATTSVTTSAIITTTVPTSTNNKFTVANTSGRRIVLLSTALDPSLQTRLQDLADSCEHVSVVNSFCDEVTHLVVSVDKRRVMQQRTMKYMQALICGAWVVTIDWVVKSLDKRALQDEAPFEVNKNCKALCDGAPAKARLAATALQQKSTSSSARPPTSSLFSAYMVLIFGQFPQSVPPKSDIQFLLQRGGATVSPSLNDFVAGAGASTPSKAAKESKPKVVVCSAKEYAQELSTSVVAVNGAVKTMAELCTSHNIRVVSTAWVLDSVGNYQVQPFLDNPFK